MTENRNLRTPVYVTKADMAVADLAAGGALVRDQLKKFLLIQIVGQVLMQRIRVTTMSREQQEIPKMTTFGNQVWYPGTESQALTLAERSQPGFDQVILTSTEIVCQVDFPRYVLKAQVEGANFKNTMIGYLGLHTKRDFENLVINGDTVGGATTFLQLFNGIVAGTTTNTYAAGAVALSSDVMRNTRLTMPQEFKSQQNLEYYTNDVAWAALDDEYAARGTPLGDTHQSKMPTLYYKGKPVHEVDLFPSTLGVGGNETVVQYMNPKNFILAFHENVEMQSEYNIRERVWTVVLTARVAQAFEHEPMAVQSTGVVGT